jgi:hypothetical protein
MKVIGLQEATANLERFALECHQHNRQIAPVARMPDRAPGCEKWRSIADLSGRRRLSAAGVNRAKVWQIGGLRPGPVGSQPNEMAL